MDNFLFDSRKLVGNREELKRTQAVSPKARNPCDKMREESRALQNPTLLLHNSPYIRIHPSMLNRKTDRSGVGHGEGPGPGHHRATLNKAFGS